MGITKYIDKNGIKFYNACLNRDSRLGVLNFSHEYDIYFKFNTVNYNLTVLSGWEMNCGGDWNWDYDDVINSWRKPIGLPMG